MSIQTEADMEKKLVTQLMGLGYQFVAIHDSADLLANLRTQLFKHNAKTLDDIPLSDGEFERILNYLDKGDVFDRAQQLRDRMALTRDNGDLRFVEFLNQADWCQNQYQVTNQITQDGTYQNRYDVTLLINGLPLVQIELKRQGVELKEAFNQIARYKRHSYSAERGLFDYVQLFVISNGMNTKFFANQKRQSAKQTFFWGDEHNNRISGLEAFTDAFLEKCQVSKMICRYIVLNQTDKALMALRPYQYFAVEKIVEQVKNGRKNGYIWHTTGSGKTLTSFKAARILTGLPKVDKVVFVVDRADLDNQTIKEFNAFAEGSVNGTKDTTNLVKQFGDPNNKLIVTTIQKLNNAVSNERHDATMSALKDSRVVFIFDECHRSQFGKTHERITSYFSKAQMFGFTGTPIFEDNSSKNEHGKRTTKDLFGDCLHRYVITDAINDQNVLKFSVEYWGKAVYKDGSAMDEKVHGIDTKEFLESKQRTQGIVEWIIQNHNRKTHDRDFGAMFAVSSVDVLIQYYEQFKAARAAGLHDLNIATIFSYSANEEDKDADGLIEEPSFDLGATTPLNVHSREKLDEFIADYNARYGTALSTKSDGGFYNYYRAIADRVKSRDKTTFQPKDGIDILLVVNMFLTGFDAKTLNTLYVDKNLRQHGLVQAFSRTNRILNEVKSQGNIVCFRNLKDNTDEAIALFSNKDASDTILVEPYESYVKEFNDGVADLLTIAPTPTDVDTLADENQQLLFVKAFRRLLRAMNVLKIFAQFKWNDLALDQKTYVEFETKYLDLRDQTRTTSGEAKVSILHEVDFELELIQRDNINVAYILTLLAQLLEKGSDEDEDSTKKSEQLKKSIFDLLGSQPQLRSKKDLIKKFIDQYLPTIKTSSDVEEVFTQFWSDEREKSFHEMIEEEGLDRDAVKAILDDYDYNQQVPRREQIISALVQKPKIRDSKTVVDRVFNKLMAFLDKFDER
jgi:type I restriction enzyme, R subunit